MIEYKLAEILKERCSFSHYIRGDLWYVTDSGFSFPVPVIELGDSEVLCKEKTMTFMKWVNRHVKYLEDASMSQRAAMAPHVSETAGKERQDS